MNGLVLIKLAETCYTFRQVIQLTRILLELEKTAELKENRSRKKIPGSIIAIGTFQVAVSLWLIFLMAITGEWRLLGLGAVIGYGVLGAGLLAVMEWARFISVVVHALLLPVILWQAIVEGQHGLRPALQTLVVIVIFYVLSRPQIRAKFRRIPYPPNTT